MKIKFGKISIGCFIVFIIGMFISFESHMPGECSGGNIGIIISPFAHLMLLIGIICGIIGIIKREFSKIYSFIGIFLNIGYIFLELYYKIGYVYLYKIWLLFFDKTVI